MSDNLVIGIDPGLSGALAISILDNVSVVDMPVVKTAGRLEVDVFRLWDILFRFHGGTEGGVVIHEQATGIPSKWAARSAFGFGSTLFSSLTTARLVGRLNEWRIETPTAWDWRSVVGLRRGDDKSAAVALASRLYPGLRGKLVETARGRQVERDGRADAVLLMHYGKLLLAEEASRAGGRAGGEAKTMQCGPFQQAPERAPGRDRTGRYH